MKYRLGKHSSAGFGTDLISFELWGSRDWCNQEVAGESFHHQPLQRLFGRPTAKHREVQTVAILVPEPDNKHDPAAVAVRIDGETVGYLPREIAGDYGAMLAELGGRGQAAQVACRVWGGMVTDYDTNRAGRLVEKERFTASVTIALAEPHLCTPVNRPPAVPHLMLPDGGAVQISGEDQCMPAIEPLLRPEGEGFAYATLHEIADTSGRTVKELVEVRLDGLRVGQLTPKMSGDLLPAIRHLEQMGLAAGAKAKLKGNRLKAEITLHCAKAHELPADWPQSTGQLPQDAAVPASAPPVAGSADALPPARAAVLPAAPPVVSDPVGVHHVPSPAAVSSPDPLGGSSWTPPPMAGHAPVPPKPTRIRFAPAPGWPPPPQDWEPPAGWQPDPQWPAAPVGWQFWVLE
jgi:collagen type III alpha